MGHQAKRIGNPNKIVKTVKEPKKLYLTVNSHQKVTSEILFYCIFQKWDQSDVDSQKLYKELLENLKYHDLSKIDSIKTYDFSTLIQHFLTRNYDLGFFRL
jgi:hypothetical protein